MKTEKQARQVTKKNKWLSKGAKKLKLVSLDSESENDEYGTKGRKNVKKGTKKKAKDDDFMEVLADSSTPCGKSSLHSVKWERIILDEVISFLLPILAKKLGY